jgi:hypothetical protein
VDALRAEGGELDHAHRFAGALAAALIGHNYEAVVGCPTMLYRHIADQSFVGNAVQAFTV